MSSERKSNRNKKQVVERPLLALSKNPTGWGSFNSTPMPTRFFTRLRYSAGNSFAPGLPQYYPRYNLNGLFQVDYPSGGHQPMGFDQISPLYQKYKVLKTHWTVRVVVGINQESTVTVVPINNSTASITTASEAAEKAGAVTKIASTYQHAVFKGSANLASLTGRTTAEYLADDIYGANVTTVPTELMILHVAINTLGGSNATGSFWIDLQYDVEFTDPIQPGQS